MVQTLTAPPMKQSDPYLAKFQELFEQAGQQETPAWVYPVRKAAMARFAELGFPTLQQEDWRFTNVAPILKLPFRPAFNAPSEGVGPELVARTAFGKLEARRLV